MNKKRLLTLLIAASLSTPAVADETEELLKLRNMTVNLIEALVAEGVLSREKADAMVNRAAAAAEAEVKSLEMRDAMPSDVVRVPYVPDFVREEIKAEVRKELKGEVVDDVVAHAEENRWGIKDALPAWTSKLKFSGDIRLRAQSDLFASDNDCDGANTLYVDYNEVNDNGGFGGSLLNCEDDRHRLRVRMRLGVDAAVTDDIKAGLRIATGSFGNPVSTNESLDNDFGSTEIVLDRAYITYTADDSFDYEWLEVTGGRMPNPWFSTDLVWDKDLNFDGLAATMRYRLSDAASSPGNNELFATLGGFMLDEDPLTSEGDKYLFGGQLGGIVPVTQASKFKLGLAYYNYKNIAGVQNTIAAPNEFDGTAPQFVQKGNTMYSISDPNNPNTRFGLASDFELVNLTGAFELSAFDPYRLTITGDMVENIGYDVGEIISRTGGTVFQNSQPFSGGDPASDQTTGFMAKVTFGWPDVYSAGKWQVFGSFRRLERDAVVDAFTDSDFHLGGTNNEGWIIGGSYGIADNTWVKLRYLSADVLDSINLAGPGLEAPLGIDVIQLDLSTKF